MAAARLRTSFHQGDAQPRDSSPVSCSGLARKTALSPQFGKQCVIFSSLVGAAGTRSELDLRPSYHLVEAIVEQSTP